MMDTATITMLWPEMVSEPISMRASENGVVREPSAPNITSPSPISAKWTPTETLTVTLGLAEDRTGVDVQLNDGDPVAESLHLTTELPNDFVRAMLNQQIQEEYLPALAISHSPPALVVGEGVEGVVASPLTAEEFSGVTVGGK